MKGKNNDMLNAFHHIKHLNMNQGKPTDNATSFQLVSNVVACNCMNTIGHVIPILAKKHVHI